MRRLLLASVVLLAASLAASIAMGDGAAGRMFLKQLAFIGDSGLGLVNSDGTDVRWLVRSGNARGGLSWSPDGRRVAFFNERAREKGATSDLYVVNVVSRSRTLVFRNAQDTSGDDPMAAAWSPDGSRLALTSAPTHKSLRTDVRRGSSRMRRGSRHGRPMGPRLPMSTSMGSSGSCLRTGRQIAWRSAGRQPGRLTEPRSRTSAPATSATRPPPAEAPIATRALPVVALLGRTDVIAVRTEHAAGARKRLQRHATCDAGIDVAAGISRHRL
jgi:hypothetical protein